MKTYKISDMNNEIRKALSEVAMPFLKKYRRMVDEDGEQMHDMVLTQALMEMAIAIPILHGKAFGTPKRQIIKATFSMSDGITAEMIEKLLDVKVQVHSETHDRSVDLSQFGEGTDDTEAADAVDNIINMFKKGGK